MVKYATHLNLMGNELQNARIQSLAVAPTSPKNGQMYFNSADKKLYVYNGTAWVDITVAVGGTLNSVTLTGTPIVKTNTSKALGNAVDDAFRVESQDGEDLFQVKTNGDTVIAGVLTVNGTGESSFAGDVNIGGNLHVDGTISGGTKVDLAEDLVVEGKLVVKGDTLLGDDPLVDTTHINGFTSIKSKATKAAGGATTSAFEVVSYDDQKLFQVMENGDAKIAGVLTVSAVNSTGEAGGTPGTTLEGDTVVDNLLVRQNLTVNGVTKLGDNATTDTTDIKGLTTVHSKTTKLLGSPTDAAFRVKASDGEDLFQVMENGDTLIAGVLKVLGTGDSEFAGNVKIGGNLTVDGDATVKGHMTGDDFNIKGNLNVEGKTVLGDNSAEDSTTILGMATIKTAGTKSDAGAKDTSVFKIEDASATPNALFDVRQNGDTIIAGALTVSGDINGGGTATKDLTVEGDLKVLGNTQLGDAASDKVTVKGEATFEQNVSMSGKKITDLADPTQATDAVNKAYVDAVRTGLDVKDSVRVATTANITLSGLQTIDGIALKAGDRVLVKNQTDKTKNGIYVAKTTAWTRSEDADGIANAGEVTSGMFLFVEEGSTNKSTGWVLATLNPITVNTTALSFVQFSGAGSFNAGDGLVQNGNTIDVVGTAKRIDVKADSIDIAADYEGQASITTVGTITAGKWQGDTIDIANGGTGATTAKAARANLGATGKHSSDIGDGTATSFTVKHNLGSADVIVSVREKATNEVVITDVEYVDANTVKIHFGFAPTANSYRVVVVG